MQEKLLHLLNHSYSPYSNFRVAAIVVTKDGQEFNGVNVENASYGATICAERVAITNAIAKGIKKEEFEKLYVMCDSDKIGTCCFICRQVISEFFDKEKEIVMMNPKGETLIKKVSELCPYPFTEENL